jgi:AhpD family alkylhydroperoxidase
MTTTNAPAPRLDIIAAAPKAVAALRRFSAEADIDPTIAELVKVRASQINGCAFCLDMHTKEAFAMGETAQRLIGLSAWRETPYYTDQERAAIAFAEAVTLIHDDGIPDDVWNAAAEHFDEDELTKLLLLTVTINAWNRIAIGAHAPAGTYEVGSYE